MKLSDLIEYLRDTSKLDQLYMDENINVDTEAVEIYMKEALSLESEIKFFRIEETGDDLVFDKDNITYIQLFPVDHAIEVLGFLNLEEGKYDKFETARRLLDYRIKDA